MTSSAEIAASAARWVVEEGMEYGPAKRRAARELGLRGARSRGLPDNEVVEQEVRAYLALFCADTQPGELAALRGIALQWMLRMAEFRPHLTGAVWRGTATRLNDVHLELYCDDSKAAEIALINLAVECEVSAAPRSHGEAAHVLTVASHSAALGRHLLVHMTVLDFDALRGALKRDSAGRTQRGDLDALRKLLEPS
jgi:hypothetical protein